MSKKSTKYKPLPFETARPHDHYSRIYDDMIYSEAYKSLSHAARTAYMILKAQYRGNYTGNSVICPYREFKQFGMGTQTVNNALSDLENKGFIQIKHGTKQAKGSHLNRQPNEYIFSDKWKDCKKESDTEKVKRAAAARAAKAARTEQKEPP